MAKKEYITPDFDEIALDLENLLIGDSEGGGSEGKEEGDPIEDPDDIGAKWSGGFNADGDY